jgi:hypothetical protein
MNRFKQYLFKILKNLKFLPKPLFLKIRYTAYIGKDIDFENPLDFNQKITWYKLYYHPPILTQLADKYAVRSYVENKIGKEYLNELYGYYNQINQIDFDSLPEQFIMKAAHGSHKTILVTDKSNLDISKTKKTLQKWLKYNHYKKVGFEWAYKNIKPGIVIEKYLKEGDQKFPIDYKFNCFDGKVKFIQVAKEENGVRCGRYYDANLIQQEYLRKNHIGFNLEIEKPILFEKMKEIAEILANRFPFVRVDLYLVDQKIIFGEMTFYPGDAKYDFVPEQYNKILGDYFKLPSLNGQKEITIYE